MTNKLWSLLIVLLVPGIAFAQGGIAENNEEPTFEFDSVFPDSSLSNAIQGITATDGGYTWIQVWNGDVFVTEDEDTLAGDFGFIHVLDEEGEHADFSPIRTLEYNDTVDTLTFQRSRGLTTDHNGDVLAAFGSRLFRLSHETGEVMDWVDPIVEGDDPQLIGKPSVTPDGDIAVAPILAVGSIVILNSNFEEINTVVDSKVGVSRTVEISTDGRYVYNFRLDGQTEVYESEIGTIGTYELADSLFLEGMYIQSSTRSPYTDNLWVVSGRGDPGDEEYPDDQYKPLTWYSFDPDDFGSEDFSFADSLTWHGSQEEADIAEHADPRAIAFSYDANQVFTGSFDFGAIPSVNRWNRTEEVVLGNELTLNVDMSRVDEFDHTPEFDADVHDVYVSGTFTGWTEPGENPDFMLEPTEDDENIYTITLVVDDEDHEYKYFLVEDDPTWDMGEWAGDPNREITVTENKVIDDTFGDQDDETVSTEDLAETEVPGKYELNQNYPNPFNPTTTIEFTIPETQSVTLTVYDMLGREVQVLVDESMQAGTHHVTFEASGLASGTYIYRLQAGEHQITRQMMFVK